jgi:hypothetical protein
MLNAKLYVEDIRLRSNENIKGKYLSLNFKGTF